MLDQINDRYNQLNKLFQTFRDTTNQIMEKMGPEVMFVNQIVAEMEVAQERKKKLIDENRVLENDIEYKKQMAKKIEETAREKANEIIAMANQRNAESIRILDGVKNLANDADIKERKNRFVEALGK